MPVRGPCVRTPRLELRRVSCRQRGGWRTRERADEVRVSHVPHPRFLQQRGMDLSHVLRVEARQLRPVQPGLEVVDGVKPVVEQQEVQRFRDEVPRVVPVDRKSTRLNSSHGYISYAVFCLKKKKKRN